MDPAMHSDTRDTHFSIWFLITIVAACMLLLTGLATIHSQAAPSSPQEGAAGVDTQLSSTPVTGCGSDWAVTDVYQSADPSHGITQANRFLSITPVGGSQVAVVYLDSGYLRLKPSAMQQEGTSNILLPIMFAAGGQRFQVAGGSSYMHYTASSDSGACIVTLSGAQTTLNGVSSSIHLSLSTRESDGATLAAVSVATSGTPESPLDPAESGLNVQMATFSSMNVGSTDISDSEEACVTGASPYCFGFTSWFTTGGLASSAANWGQIWSNADPGFGYVTLMGQPNAWVDSDGNAQQPRPTIMLSDFVCSGCDNGWGTDGWIDNRAGITSNSDNVGWWMGAIRAASMPTSWSYTLTATQPSSYIAR